MGRDRAPARRIGPLGAAFPLSAMPTLSHTLERLMLGLLPSAWRDRLRQVSGSNKAILRGMGWVAVFLLVAKLIAAGKEMLVAYRYGTSPVVDGYLFVFNLAQWPTSVFFSVISFVLIPYLVRLRTDNPDEACQLQKALVPAALGAGIGVSLLVGLGVWWLVREDLTGLDGVGKAAALAAIPWLAPTIALAFPAAIYSTWLMSERRHANTLLEAMPAVGIALCLIYWPFGAGANWDVLPLAVGTLAGFLLQTVLLARLAGSKAVTVTTVKLSAHWPALGGAFSTMLLAQVVITSSGLIDQFLAVRMGEGVLTTLSYAQRLMALVLGLSATVIGRAMLPVFSGVADPRQSFALAKRWAWSCALAGLAGMLLMALLAKPSVALLFERGAFSENDTQAVSLVLVILGVQLPFYLASIVLVQWIGAIGKPAWLLVAASSGLLAKFVSAIALFDFGAAGLAGATVIMYTVTTGVIYIISHRSLQRSRRRF